MIDPEVDREDGAGTIQATLLMRTHSFAEAVIVRQLLSTYDIPCQISSRFSNTIFPLDTGFADVRVYVFRDDVERSRDLLADHRRDCMRVMPGGRDGSRKTERNG